MPDAQAYAPIDDLIASVTQLGQSGEVTDSSVGAELTVRLQTIGAWLDGGDPTTARSLLLDFAEVEVVQGLNGVSCKFSSMGQFQARSEYDPDQEL